MVPMITNALATFALSGTWLVSTITLGFVNFNLAFHSLSSHVGLVTITCHSESFAFCHSECSQEPRTTQDRLRQESRPFASLLALLRASAQGDKIDSH